MKIINTGETEENWKENEEIKAKAQATISKANSIKSVDVDTFKDTPKVTNTSITTGKYINICLFNITLI